MCAQCHKHTCLSAITYLKTTTSIPLTLTGVLACICLTSTMFWCPLHDLARKVSDSAASGDIDSNSVPLLLLHQVTQDLSRDRKHPAAQANQGMLLQNNNLMKDLPYQQENYSVLLVVSLEHNASIMTERKEL